MVPLHRDLQPVGCAIVAWRHLEAAALPGEAPVAAIRTVNGVRFCGKIVEGSEVRILRSRKALGDALRLFTGQFRAGAGLLDGMRETDDVAVCADLNVE